MNIELMFKLSALGLDYFKLSEVNLLMLNRLFSENLVIKCKKPFIQWSKRVWLIQDLFKISIINGRYLQINDNYYRFFGAFVPHTKHSKDGYTCSCNGVHININKGNMFCPSYHLIVLEPAQEEK